MSVVGGNLSSWGRWPPVWPFEFNLAKDVAAARAVFESPVARRVYPLDACVRLTVGVRTLFEWRRGSALGRYLVGGSLRWLAYAPVRYRRLSFPVWDLVPALDAAGVLVGGKIEEGRRLRVEGRGLLVEDRAAVEAVCLRRIEREGALRAFGELLARA